MNLVVGATGYLGSEICRQLVQQGKPVRALIRPTSDPAKVEALRALGVETIEGDLKNPDSLAAACHNVAAVVSTATTTTSRQEGDSIETVDQEGQRNLIEAARGAGVEKFVFISFRDNPNLKFPLSATKRDVEKRLMESGLTYTILQAGYFMEMWLGPALGFDYPNAKATIYGSGENGISWVSLVDVAQFAVAALDNPAARNAVIEVGGPEALSPIEVVQTFEEVSGRSFEVQHVPEEALRDQREQATDSLSQSFAGLMLQYAQGDAIDMSQTLQRFPITLTSVRDYAKRVMNT